MAAGGCVLELYQSLAAKPFGFMPCNLTAFVLGFVLKEYCRGEYRWSDNYVDKKHRKCS